ncbi:MAG TPA: nucleotidyl transferase AbiEii/AbiGii toxin family protein [Pyrinomonadaceae bacterium]|nr:nucleotidyl transferase AbiEii/AbiGii toxin family protein [Pyrinomonadaceae bacterium]
MATSYPTGNSESIVDLYGEALRYFMGQGNLNRALAHVAADLQEHGIDYIVVGALALFAHGYPRLTEDIDLVLTTEGLNKLHEQLIGLGYVPAFPGARKRLRSTKDGVRIDVIAAGEYPGDGKPKPVSFPNPADSSIEIDGVNFATLEKLIELKLASGMTAPDRLKDLADVQELIKFKHLARDFADKLNPYVREKYLELWNAVESGSSNTFEEQE